MKKILCFLFITMMVCALKAQAQTWFNYGNKKTADDLYDACRAQDGGVWAVGASDAEDWKGWDATLMKIDHLGAKVFQQRLGTVRGSDFAWTVAEDPSGKVWVGGGSDSSGIFTAWIACRTPLGGPIWRRAFFTDKNSASVRDIETARDGKSMGVCGIKAGRPWFTRLDMEGNPLFTPVLYNNSTGFPALDVEQLTLTEGNTHWFVFGCGKDASGDKRAFFAKITPNGDLVKTLVLTEQIVESTGRFLITTGGNLLGVGTAKVPPSQEEAFTWYVPTNLDPQQAGFHTFGGRDKRGARLDEANDIIALDATTCLVVGSTRSHKPGALVSNLATWRVNHYGERTDDDMADYGERLEERGIRAIRMYSGDVWVCGTLNDGGTLRDDRNFVFARLELLTLPWRNTATTDNIAFNAPDKAPSIQPGGNGALSVEVFNRATDPMEGLYITAQCPPDMQGCYAGVRFALPPVLPGERFVAQIPLWADMEAPPNVKNLKLELSNAAGTVLARKTTSLSLEALKSPEIQLTKAVSVRSKKATLILGERNIIEVSLKNTGQAFAKNAVIAFAVSNEGVVLGGKTEFVVADWPVGSEQTYPLSIKLSRNYNQAKVVLKVYLSGDNLIHQPDLIVSFDPVAEEVSAATQEDVVMPGVDLDAQWDDGNDALTRRTNQPKYELTALLSANTEVGYDNIWIRHNKDRFSIAGIRSDEFQLKKKGQSNRWFRYHLNADVTLIPGDNTFQIILEKGGKRAECAPLVVRYAPEGRTLHAVCIGVPDNTEQLKYPPKDAQDMAHLFATQAGKLFNEVKTYLYATPDSTEAGMLGKAIGHFALLAKRGELKKDDAVLFYIATHGYIQEQSECLRLRGSDFDLYNERFTSLSFQENFLDVLETLPCQTFVFIDACHSGAFKACGKTDLSTQVIASCGAEESSYEASNWKNGAFTKVLKDVLMDQSTCRQLDKDGQPGLSMAELYAHLRTKVPDLVAPLKKPTAQTPFALEGTLREKAGVWGY